MRRFKQRVRIGALVVSLPVWAALLLTLFTPTFPTILWWWVPAALVTYWLSYWHRNHVVYPLYTLSGLLTAMRQGDYSMRGAHVSVLRELIGDANALAEHLQHERIEFEESSYLLSKTLRALDSAVFVFDDENRLRLVNPAAQKIMGTQAQQLFGHSAEDLGLANLLNAAPERVVDHAFPGRSGRFELRRAPLRSGGHGGQLLVLNDVGRVLREEERQAWKRLLRVLGHEVNNSLAPIRSMVGTVGTLLSRDPLPEDWREDACIALAIVEKRAAALSRFLAGYSKLTKLPPPVKVAAPLQPLIHKVALLEDRVPINVRQGPAVTLRVDPDQLEQALINLLRNGAEASMSHAGKVELGWCVKEGCVLIDINDQGEGPPLSENLFVPFYTTKEGGSGIGLALVRQIAEAHDGGVQLQARENVRGTRATLWLPLSQN